MRQWHATGSLGKKQWKPSGKAKPNKMNRTRRFTLVELMAVIAIIAILAGIVMGGLSFASRKSMEAQTIAKMEQFQIALENFHKDYGYYPVQETAGNVDFTHSSTNRTWDLFTNHTQNKHNKPYMEGIHDEYGLFLDGNGVPFQYQYPADSTKFKNTTKYVLWSKGADGKSKYGTDGTNKSADDKDDICSWKQK